MRLRLVGLMAALTMILASCGGTVPEAAGPSEGIQVHGDWTIDIYNEDGSLDHRYEFSNRLADEGVDLLAKSILGITTPSGVWRIDLIPLTSQTLCSSQTDGSCEFDAAKSWDFGDDSLVDSLTLSASGAVEHTADIVNVGTETGTCINDVAPVDCTLGVEQAFTLKLLDEAVSVEAGQVVQVDVTISFTSG